MSCGVTIFRRKGEPCPPVILATASFVFLIVPKRSTSRIQFDQSALVPSGERHAELRLRPFFGIALHAADLPVPGYAVLYPAISS